MHFLFITDPWNTLDHPKDTTLRLMEEAVSMGHKVSWTSVSSISLSSNDVTPAATATVLIDARRLLKVKSSRNSTRSSTAFQFDVRLHLEKALLPLDSFDQIHYRVDPPVDLGYLHPLTLLGHNPKSRLKIVNGYESLTGLNEKFSASRLPGLTPSSTVTAHFEIIRSFLKTQKIGVVKPLHEAQSKGVHKIQYPISSADRKILKLLTHDFTRLILLQEYLPKIETEGEVRLWIVDGTLIAHAIKRPKNGTFKIDMDQGGFLDFRPLTKHESHSAKVIGRFLKKNHVRLAAVDLIDGKVTDFNITSPGLIVAMETLLKRNLSKEIIKRLASRKDI